MKKLLLIVLILFAGNATASSLPNCPSDPFVRWNNCFGTSPMGDDGKDSYTGEWKDNIMHGQGTYSYISGDTYVGEYKDDKMHGQGTYTWADGAKYVGEWKDNKKHGQGTFTYPHGTEESGYYMNGKYIPTICENMGLTKGSDPFGNCVLELIKEINKDD